MPKVREEKILAIKKFLSKYDGLEILKNSGTGFLDMKKV